MVLIGLLEFIVIVVVTYLLADRQVSDKFLMDYAQSNNAMLDWFEKPSRKEE